MKITKITINNLASIAGEHVIDFTKEPLKSAGIFAISGPTGSGKSTILDALCLALYDRIPRFQQSTGKARMEDGEGADISQNDVRNILRRGTGNGFAEVEFEADDQVCYASRWSVHRSHNSPSGNLQSQRIRVVNVTTQTELQGTKTELLAQLERLIGLSYEQFTRTVLLAQNDFATFLKSDENAKAELLEKLTGTDIYSKISIKLYELTKEKNTEVNLVKTQIDAVEILADELVEQLTLEEKKGEEQLKANRKKQLEATTLKETFDEIDKQQRELAQKEKELIEKKSLLEKHKEAVAQIREQQNEFEKQKKQQAPLISKATQLDALIVENTKDSEALAAKVSEAQQLKINKQKELQEKEKLQKQVREKASTIYRSLKLNQSFDSMGAVYTYLDGLKVAVQDKLNLLTKNKEGLGLDKIYKQQATLDIQKAKLHQLDSDFKLFTEKSKALQDLQKQVEADQILELEVENKKKKLSVSLPLLEKELENIKLLYEKVQRKMNSSVEAIRATLQKNEPCPVCGSIEHHLNTQEVHTEHSVLKEEMEQLQKKYTSQTTDLKVADKESVRLVALNKQNTIKLKELQEACLKYRSNYTDEVFQAQYIQEQQARLQELSDKLVAVVSQGNEIQKEIDQLIQERNRLQEQQDQLHKAHDAYLVIKNEYEGLNKEYAALALSYEEKFKEYQAKQNQFKALQKERKELLGGMSVLDFQAQLDAQDLQLKEQYESLERQKQELSTDQAKLSGQLEQLKQSLAALGTKVKGVSKEDNEAQLEECKEQIDQLEKSLSNLKSKLSTDKNNRARKEQLKKNYDNLVKAAEDWNKLNTVFGQSNGAKFQVIAQSYTLRVLLLQANEHLKYLAPRYRLEQIGTALALKIIDQDMGDAERTVYSLSGGESFLVSLALALGLSSISSGNLQVDSLFIDEGFGSLDTESLLTAMDALEQLQRLGRKVGVISHVQEMSERIAVQIRLEKGVSGKSTLTIA